MGSTLVATCVHVLATTHVVYAHVTPPLGRLLGCRGGRPRLTVPFSPELAGVWGDISEARSALSPPTHPLDAWRGSGTFNPLRVFCVSTP